MEMPEMTRPSTSIVTRLLCQMPGSLNDALRTMVEAAEIIEQYRADAVYDETVILKLKAHIEALEAALQLIVDDYENQEIPHVDYRVKVYQVARAALEKDAEQ